MGKEQAIHVAAADVPVAPPIEVAQQSAPTNPGAPAPWAQQDILSLRSQIRRLEVSLNEEKHQSEAVRKESDRLRAEIHEKQAHLEMQKRTEETMQMEYI